MRKLTEILRLYAAGLSKRQIAKSCNIARSTVADHLERMHAAGLKWPLPRDLDGVELERLLFGGRAGRRRDDLRPLPDWPSIHKELHKKGVTLKLQWQEYREAYPDGYAYTQFCEHYRRWCKSVDVCLRQTHPAGERLFVDYAGVTMPVTDPRNGEVREAQIFVAALGASHYLYAEATRTQQSRDWIEAHIHTYEHLLGVPEITVSDNLPAGVSKACRYEPDINPTYHDMATHYGTAIIPTRARHPRDNAKAESGVQIIEQEVLAPLRHQTFFSLAELNRAIRQRLKEVNHRPFQKLDASRWDLFVEIDKPALKPLPAERYEYADFLKARVNIDYHIEVKGHYYSVPYELVRQQLDVRLTARMVEALYKGRRVASHMRDDRKGRHTTDPSHMPKAHREHLSWTPRRIIHWASTIGPSCSQAATQIIESRAHPEQGYRACLGIIRLASSYPSERVEAACRRALDLDVCSFKSIKSILKTRKDLEPLPADSHPSRTCPCHHQNVRGTRYYATEQDHDRSQPTEKGGI
jgi:transposase